MLRHQIAWEIPGEPVLGELEVRRAIGVAFEEGGEAGFCVGVVFVDDDTLARMHADHLDDPSPTDVITFDLRPVAGDTPDLSDGPQAELYVSVDRARSVAVERGVDLTRELTLYVVHGVLHLVGHDDVETEARRRMRHAESAVMLRLGFPPDEEPHDRTRD